ncbi:hypothetical protein L1987_82755 [Smallanthus sonchifolius]|uniref:Uncharacterized protein n=1 Tax=Smallanthus sonchifolius TaxID=185202 RepID=A0ACB8YBQ8_9ASTR|nr:hypothetical protein L1987_82755 [Smallanthus sonchifolius]
MRMSIALLGLEITFSNVKIQNAIKKSYLLFQESLNLTSKDLDAYDTLHLKVISLITLFMTPSNTHGKTKFKNPQYVFNLQFQIHHPN